MPSYTIHHDDGTEPTIVNQPDKTCCTDAGMDHDDPDRAAHGIILAVAGGLLLWCVVALCVLAVRGKL